MGYGSAANPCRAGSALSHRQHLQCNSHEVVLPITSARIQAAAATATRVEQLLASVRRVAPLRCGTEWVVRGPDSLSIVLHAVLFLERT